MMSVVEQANAIVYEDEELRVHWHPGSTEFALVTFGDLVGVDFKNSFYAEDPVRKLGLTCLGFVAKTPNWYPSSNVAAAVRTVAGLISKHRIRVLYGGSMGGYAALKFSKLLGATHVIAMCPQWSIDPVECAGMPSGYDEYFRSSMSGMSIRETDMLGRVYLLVDGRLPVDRYHQQMISGTYLDVNVIHVPAAGHHVASVLAGSEHLLAMIQAVCEERSADLVTLMRRQRRSSLIMMELMLLRGLERHPLKVAKVLESRKGLDTRILALGGRHLMVTLKALCSRREYAAAAAHLRSFRMGLTSPRDSVTAAALHGYLTGSECLVKTFHGTALFFDLVAGIGRHLEVEVGTAQRHLVPVRIQQHGIAVQLFAVAAGIRMILGVNDREELTNDFDGVPAERRSSFELYSSRPGTISLRSAGLYISAEPNGRVVCNRASSAEWEELHVE